MKTLTYLSLLVLLLVSVNNQCPVVNCSICTNATDCGVCVAGYYANPPTSCNNTCSANITYCTTCVYNTATSSLTCLVCSDPYYATVIGTCYPCAGSMSNCAKCTNGTTCITCQKGYYPQTANICSACFANVTNCVACTANLVCTQCALGFFLALPSICDACTMPGCSNCSALATCVQCITGYYLSGGLCSKCTDPNCVDCNAVSQCTTCDSDWITTDSSTCHCKVGAPLTGICMNTIGCVTAKKISGVNTCIFCDSTKEYIIHGPVCICKTGYKNESNVCTLICGDTLVMGNQTCDDGNLLNDDGCSSICQQQTNYDCRTTSSGYHCVYSATFNMKLQYIWRDQNQNKATIYIKIDPLTPNLGLVNLLTTSTIYITGGAYTLQSVQYQSPLLKLTVPFTEDIEGYDITYTLNFNPDYFTASASSITFKAKGTNSPLLINNFTGIMKLTRLSSLGLLGFLGLIVLLSIAYQKMISIQTVNIIQILVLSKLTYRQDQDQQIIDAWTKGFQYLIIYTPLGQDLSKTHQLTSQYSQLIYNPDFIINFQLGLGVIILSMIICLIYWIYQKKMSAQKFKSKCMGIDQVRLFQQKLNQNRKFIYQRVVLHFALLIILSYYGALCVQSRALAGQVQYQYFALNLGGCIFAMLYLLGIIGNQIINIGKPHQIQPHFTKQSNYYISYYCIWILLVPVMISFGQAMFGFVGLMITSVPIVLNLILVVLWRPYVDNIHNIILIINNSWALCFLAGQTILSYHHINTQFQMFIQIGLVGFTAVVQILALVRILYATKVFKKEVIKFNKNQIKQEINIIKQNDQENKDKQRKAKRKPYSREQQIQQEQDILKQIKMRLKKQYNQITQKQIY